MTRTEQWQVYHCRRSCTDGRLESNYRFAPDLLGLRERDAVLERLRERVLARDRLCEREPLADPRELALELFRREPVVRELR
jgi:hypothetical protein